MADKLGTNVNFKATKVEYPNKTLEEIQAEVDAFNKAQREKIVKNEE